MQLKNQYKSLITILFFSILVSSFTPVVALNTTNETKINKNAETQTATQNATQKINTTSPTPAQEGPKNTENTEEKTNKKNQNTPQKTTIYKGEISATPSAIGKFLVKTATTEKNVDTDKTTKVFVYANRKTSSTVSKLKIKDKVTVIGKMNDDNTALLAQFILVQNEEQQTEKHIAGYGTVTSREASGSAFKLEITKPGKNETRSYVLNNTAIIKVKDIETPKLSDIKIGDRVTFTFSESKSDPVIKKIYAIPGRGAGLLRDIRESSPSIKNTDKPQATVKTTTTPNATVSATPTKIPQATQTATSTATKKPTPN